MKMGKTQTIIIWIIWNQVSVQKYPRRKNAGEPQDGSASHMSRGNKLIINANPSVIFSSASSPQCEQLIDILISAFVRAAKSVNILLVKLNTKYVLTLFVHQCKL